MPSLYTDGSANWQVAATHKNLRPSKMSSTLACYPFFAIGRKQNPLSDLKICIAFVCSPITVSQVMFVCLIIAPFMLLHDLHSPVISR